MERIFGYAWEDIQAAQQKRGSLNRPLTGIRSGSVECPVCGKYYRVADLSKPTGCTHCPSKP